MAECRGGGETKDSGREIVVPTSSSSSSSLPVCFPSIPCRVAVFASAEMVADGGITTSETCCWPHAHPHFVVSS